MKYFANIRFPVRVTLGIAALALLGACSSGGDSDFVDPVVIEDISTQNQPTVTGAFELDGSLATQTFSLLEDSSLKGRFFSDSDSSDGTAAVRSLPQNGFLTIEPNGQDFVYTPQVDFFGEDGFIYRSVGGIDVNVLFAVQPQNDAPVLINDIPRVAAQGVRFSFILEATDVDDDELSFTASELPDWMSLDSISGAISGFPTQADVGLYENVTLRVSDSDGLFDELSGVTFEVVDVNDTPTLNLTQMPEELLARESVTVRVFPDDADGDSVELDVEDNRFIDATVDGIAITLTAADVNEVTDVNLVLIATDRQGGVTREIVQLRVYPHTESEQGITLFGSKEGRGVHVVVLGDGYVADQQTLFRENVEDLLLRLQDDDGIAAHMGAFNFHMISTISEDTGADDSDLNDNRDTYFDSAYNCNGIARLICANTLTMLEQAIIEYPSFDQIILLVNDLRYGGSGNSGGSIAITSAYAPEIALHEMGHSLADLADEYVDNLILETTGLPSFEEGRFPNVTALTDPTAVPWAHWIDTELPLPQNAGDTGVGLFEGGLYRSRNVYRPTFDSRMRSFDADFGPVNSEQWILRLYTLTDGIRGIAPTARTVIIPAGETQIFEVSPIFGPEVQQVRWRLNGRLVEPDSDPNVLAISPNVGTHVLSMTVSDISGAIRKPLPHAGVFTWSWDVEVR